MPFRKDENVWVYLAKHVMNASDFCLTGGTSVEQTLTSCLIGVCTPLSHMKNHTVFQFITKPISYSDIYNWGPISSLKDGSMFSLKVTAVTLAETCVKFSGCSNECFKLSANISLNCSSAPSVSYASAHVKRPAGWFLRCGKTVSSCVPAYSTGDLAPSGG